MAIHDGTSPSVNKLLGTMLLERGLISQNDVEQALSLHSELGTPVGEALVRIGALSEDNLINVLSDQMGIPLLPENLYPKSILDVQQTLESLGLSSTWVSKNKALVWAHEEGSDLFVAAVRPMAPDLREAIEIALVKNDRLSTTRLHFYFIKSASIDQYVSQTTQASSVGNDDDVSMQKLREMAEEAPVIDFVNRLFENALTSRASDVHIEPSELEFEIRFRVDGIMTSIGKHPASSFDAVISRIKLLSGMDIAEQRLPQDGRQSIRLSGERVDLRVSSLPGTWGESLVVRLLRKNSALPSLSNLGLRGFAESELEKALSESNGVILITGPTGSGKSTTLYKLLERLNDGNRKIITVEDPVEYDMVDVTQIQVRPDIGYTFQRGLRAILRHDPDVVMVGEIRDGETATIAAQAALTGHVVFSTLHTNSALGAIERLVDLGLERFLVASSARAFAAQRLVRKLCDQCCEPDESGYGQILLNECRNDGAHLDQYMSTAADWKTAKGCAACGFTGYSGRLGLYEVAYVDDRLRSVITKGASEAEIVEQLRSGGFLTLFEDGLLKARDGLTSVNEVARVMGKREAQALS